MLILTLPQIQAVIVPLIATVIGTTAVTAWYLYQQEQAIQALNADLDEVWLWAAEMHAWAHGGDDDGPPPDDDPDDPDPRDDGPPTVEADVLDTWARQAVVLSRPTEPLSGATRAAEWVEQELTKVRARSSSRAEPLSPAAIDLSRSVVAEGKSGATEQPATEGDS